MFSPVKTKKKVPEFLKSLEPEIFKELKKEEMLPVQQNAIKQTAKATAQKDPMAAAVIKHKMSIMHLFLPGPCKFVSIERNEITRKCFRSTV